MDFILNNEFINIGKKNVFGNSASLLLSHQINSRGHIINCYSNETLSPVSKED